MALADFVNKTGLGGSGTFHIFAINSAGTVGTEVVTTGITQGIPNVKDSTLTGSVEGKNLVLTANVAIMEQVFVDHLAGNVNSTEISQSDWFFENSMNLPQVTGYSVAAKVLVIHYMPANQEGLVKTTAFVGLVTRESNAPTTAENEPNIVPIVVTGTYAPAAVTIATTMTNTLVVTAMSAAKTLPDASYGVLLNKDGDTGVDTDWLASA